MELEIKTLKEKINALEAQGLAEPGQKAYEGSPRETNTGDASLLETVETRLEAKIEASMEAASVLVADTMNARFTEALKFFEGHITCRRKEEEVARAQIKPSNKTT